MDSTAEQMTFVEDDAIAICRTLIRIDTSNTGGHDGAWERPAAEAVAALLAEAGVDSALVEPERGRSSLLARVPGADPARSALVVHGHLDVVPAFAPEWAVAPFAGELSADHLWGRGAVDMKNMVAMTLAVVRGMLRQGRRPSRDLVLAFFADEEAGSYFGSRAVVARHPEHFENATEAISEVGGFSATLDNGVRVYLLETAQKGLAWFHLQLRGTPGHGSMLNPDNPVTRLAGLVAKVGDHRFPIRLTSTTTRFLEEICDAVGMPFDASEPEAVLARLGPLARQIGATLRHTVTPTMLDAGYKANVVPGTASATIDARFVPGREREFLTELETIIGPDVIKERINGTEGLESPVDVPLVQHMIDAVTQEDPGARVVPYCLSAATDNTILAQLGIRGYGFVPLRLDPELDFSALFHGVDERIPLAALRFGVRVLDRFLSSC